ncbi:MAG: leucine-rich repeat domain-containing protein [Bacteroidales bacterium]
MKRNFLKGVMLMAMLLVSVNVWAYDFEVDGLYYEINTDEDLTCAVSGNDDYVGELVIPETVENDGVIYTVTAIQSSAFVGNTAVTKVTIPATLISVGDDAFTGCSNITEVIFEDSDEVLSLGYSDMYYAIFKDAAIERVYIGRNMSFGFSPIKEQTSLTTAEIGELITSIDNNLFWECSALTSITIPDNVKTIGSRAFARCTSLSEIDFGTGVSSIGVFAFTACDGLVELVIPDNVTFIDEWAFSSCANLTTVRLSSTMETISNYMFYFSSKLANVTIPEGITSIDGTSFYNCAEIKSITLPSTMSAIGANNFQGCEKIVEVYAKNPTPSMNVGANFESDIYANATLYVPIGSLELYKVANDWCDFENIVESDFSGVESVTSDNIKFVVTANQLDIKGAEADAEIVIYSMNGTIVYKGIDKVITLPNNGVYIVKIATGKVFKVLI